MHLDRLARHADEMPFANQIYIDVANQQTALVKMMHERGILPIGYRALAFLPIVAMAADMGDGTQAALVALKEALGANSVQQVVLAWLVRRGVHVLAKSASKARIEENLQAEALAASPHWTDALVIALNEADGNELVNSIGGDEAARVFMASPGHLEEPSQAAPVASWQDENDTL